MSRTQALAADAVTELYSDHHGWLRGWLRKRLGCSETAADLAQDTFMRILRKESNPRPDSPRAYLSAIASELAVSVSSVEKYVARGLTACALALEPR